MQDFYRRLLVDHMSPAAALRAAQLSLRQNPRWAHPYFWAGFVVQGEPR
jgi:CHAT domain-containing protein